MRRLPVFTAFSLAAALLAASALTACSGIKTEAPEVNPTDMPKGPGLLSGESGNLLDAFKKGGPDGQGGSGGVIGVNIYLWRAAVESIAFMPIVQADSNGGVIATDWYTQPENPSERVRANVLILGKTLRADALKVSLFKQQKKGEAWVDVPVAPRHHHGAGGHHPHQGPCHQGANPQQIAFPSKRPCGAFSF